MAYKHSSLEKIVHLYFCNVISKGPIRNSICLVLQMEN